VLEVLIESLTLSDFFTKLGAVTDTDTIMNPHFGSDPADISGSGPGLVRKSVFESRITFG